MHHLSLELPDRLPKPSKVLDHRHDPGQVVVLRAKKSEDRLYEACWPQQSQAGLKQLKVSRQPGIKFEATPKDIHRRGVQPKEGFAITLSSIRLNRPDSLLLLLEAKYQRALGADQRSIWQTLEAENLTHAKAETRINAPRA